MFFLELLVQHLQLLLYFFLCLRAILFSCRYLIASVFKDAFITSGFAWTCNFASPLGCQKPSSFLCHVQVYYLLLLLMVLLTVVSLPFHLDILVYEQLDVFIDRKVHRHLIDWIPSGALNGAFDSALLEANVPVLLRGRWTPVIPGDITTLMERNLLVENQNKLEDWHATYMCDCLWRLHNFQREVGKLTTKNEQGTVQIFGRLTEC